MTRFEEVRAGVSVRGISPDGLVKVVGVEWYGDGAIKVVYEDGDGTTGSRLIHRDEESTVDGGLPTQASSPEAIYRYLTRRRERLEG